MGCVSFPSLRCAVCFLINLTNEEVNFMPESQNIPGRKPAATSMILAIIAFLYLMLVPVYATSFFTLILAIVDIAVSTLLIAVLIAALVGAGGDF